MSVSSGGWKVDRNVESLCAKLLEPAMKIKAALVV